MHSSTKSRIALAAGLSALFLVSNPIGCVEVEDEADDIADPQNRDPGAGSGSASWSVLAGGQTLVFTASIANGVASAPTLMGTPPPFSSLPLMVTNADGEDLFIDTVTISSTNYRRYSGAYEITIDSDDSSANCTECACSGFANYPPCTPTLSLTDCSSTTTSCSYWPCGTGGGGVVQLDLNFTAVPGAPW